MHSEKDTKGGVEADETEPIFLLARDCDTLFQEICGDEKASPSLKRHLDEYNSLFNAWASFLGVFSGQAASLDHRLRRHPDYLDMIARLLDTLRRNLFALSLIPSSIVASGDVGEHVILDSVTLEQNSAVSGIAESISRLNKLGIAIRQSSRSTITARARRFAAQHLDLDAFEDTAYDALETLYPNAPETLRRQLCNSMADRYVKHQYEAYRLGKSSIHHPLVATQRVVQDSVTISQNNAQSEVHLEEEVNTPYATHLQPIHQPNPTYEMRASTIDTRLLHQNIAAAAVSVSRPSRTLSVFNENDRQNEPPPPKFELGKDLTECEWCFQLIDRSLIDNMGWSSEGRRHYRRDLQPFICISEDCIDSRPGFQSRTEWFEHMKTHSSAWSQQIHQQHMWQCYHTHDQDTAYIFSNPGDLYNHILLHHEHHAASPNTSDIWERVTKSAVGDRSADICPLCFYDVSLTDTKLGKRRRQLPDEGPEKRVKFAARTSQSTFANGSTQREAVSPEIAGTDLVSMADEDKTDEHESDVQATPYSLGWHIAAHLQFLMFLSLRLMATHDMKEKDDDVRSFSLAPESGGSQSEERRAEVYSDVTSAPVDHQNNAGMEESALVEGDYEERMEVVLSNDILHVPDTAPQEDINWEGLWEGNPTPRFEEVDEPALASLQYRPDEYKNIMVDDGMMEPEQEKLNPPLRNEDSGDEDHGGHQFHSQNNEDIGPNPLPETNNTKPETISNNRGRPTSRIVGRDEAPTSPTEALVTTADEVVGNIDMNEPAPVFEEQPAQASHLHATSGDLKTNSPQRPDRQQDPAPLHRSMTQWDRIVKELVDTERKYVQDLENSQSIKMKLKTTGGFSEDSIQRIFLNIDEIVDFQRLFLAQVEKISSMPAATQRWGEHFVLNEGAFDIYQPFISNQNKASQTFTENLKRVNVSRHLPATDISTLHNILLEPMQRLVKYHLFLKGLLERTEDEETINDLVTGRNSAERILHEVGRAVDQAVNDEALQDLIRRMDDWKSSSLEQFGKLLLHGCHSVSTSTKAKLEKNYMIYLFENIILFCKDTDPAKAKDQKDKPKSRIRKIDLGRWQSKGAKLHLSGRLFMQNVTEVVSLQKPGLYSVEVWWKSSTPTVEWATISFLNETDMRKWAAAIEVQRKLYAPSDFNPPSEFQWIKESNMEPLQNPYLQDDDDSDDDIDTFTARDQSIMTPHSNQTFHMAQGPSSSSSGPSVASASTDIIGQVQPSRFPWPNNSPPRSPLPVPPNFSRNFGPPAMAAKSTPLAPTTEPPLPTQWKVRVSCDDDRHLTVIVNFNITYQALIDRIDAKLARFTSNTINGGFLKLRYRDEDGDLVTIATDDDIQIMFTDLGETIDDSKTGRLGEIELFCGQ